MVPLEVASHCTVRRPGVAEGHVDTGVGVGQGFDGLPVRHVRGGRRVVQEGDGPGMALVGEGAQHRQHRSDAAAAADEHEPVRPLRGQAELAGGGREVDDVARGGVLVQVP